MADHELVEVCWSYTRYCQPCKHTCQSCLPLLPFTQCHGSNQSNCHLYVHPLLEYASPVWSPSYLLNYLINHIESVQTSFTKRLPFCKSLSYAERLTYLRLQSFEHRRMIFDSILVFKVIHGFSCSNFDDFFSFANNNPFRLYIPINRNNTCHFSFSFRVILVWNSLPDLPISA